MPRILVLLMAVFLATQAAAGTWTDNQFVYKPSLGAKGETEKNTFDSGLDRVDAHLGKYKTLGSGLRHPFRSPVHHRLHGDHLGDPRRHGQRHR